MATTNNLGITLVEQSQSQKEVTVNQAFTRLDAILNAGVIDLGLDTPPGSPSTGDLYIVGSTPTGAWAGQDGKLAYFDQIWRFVAPNEGMTLWVNDEDLIYTYDGSDWVASILGETNTASNLGSGEGVFESKSGMDLQFKSLVAGTNISISSDSDEITIEAAGGAGSAYTTIQEEGSDLTQRNTVNFVGGGITATDDAGNSRTTVTLDATLNALAAYNTNGIICQTAADTFAGRTLTGPAAGITVTNGNGVSGNPTLALADDLAALEGLNTLGFAVRTGTNTWTQRSLDNGPGILITDTFGATQNPLIALTTDALALENLSGTGFAVRTATNTWTQRSITGGGGVTVTNGDGVSGNPTMGISAKRTLWIPAAAMRPSASGGCATLALLATSADHPDLSTLDFDPGTEEYAQFWVAMPKGWNEGTVTAQFLWSHPSTSTDFDVIWGLQGVAISNDDTIDTAYGAAQTATDTGGTTSDLYISPETSAITLGGSPAEGDMVAFRVFRKAADGSDTLAVDARLHGIKLYYTITTLDDA